RYFEEEDDLLIRFMALSILIVKEVAARKPHEKVEIEEVAVSRSTVKRQNYKKIEMHEEGSDGFPLQNNPRQVRQVIEKQNT
ncbi:hypothetical protein HAX54_008902, partial [Datura stramonium]|nr:hypothetical protein [Datura stramonium]